MSFKEDLNLNPLRYTNRASCANDSKKPTRSLFLIVDSYNAGKFIAARAGRSQSINQDLKLPVIKNGLQQWRLRLSNLSQFISRSLLSGDLPLINETDKKYLKLQKKCKNNLQCPELYNYISEKWGDLDPALGNSEFNQDLGCYYIKSFSPLQDHLFTERNQLDKNDLINVAQAALNMNDLVTQCNNPDKSLDAFRFVLQLDVLKYKNKIWNKIGFNYWNSFKAYLSWAWRQEFYLNSKNSFLRSIDLEESIVMTPNGCKSVDRPACSVEQISTGALRTIGLSQRNKSYKNVVSVSPENMLLRNLRPEVNNDGLGMLEYEETKDWLGQFLGNIDTFSNSLRARLWNGVNTLKLITQTIPLEELLGGLNKLKNKSEFTQLEKNHINYMCGEFIAAYSERLGYFRNEIQSLSKIKDVPAIESLNDGKGLSSHLDYFNSIDKEVQEVCEYFSEENKIWASDFKSDTKGLKTWYRQLYNSEKIEVRDSSIEKDEEKLLVENDQPLIIAAPVFCVDSVDCARMLLESLVNITSYTNYMETIESRQNKIRSAALFNPYKERVACGLYDPWGNTKKTIQKLFFGLTSAAVFGYNNLPVFVGAHIQPGRTYKFDRLVENGEFKLNSKKTKSQLRANLIANLGPLAGAPCVVSIGNAGFNPKSQYVFRGLTIGASVNGKRKRDVQQEDINTYYVDRDNGKPAVGVSCSILFSAATEAEQRAFDGLSNSNIIGHFQLLRTAVNFFKGITNKVDNPRSRTVDINDVVNSYNRGGEVGINKCKKRLTKNKSCKVAQCETHVENFLDQNWSADLLDYDFNSKTRVISFTTTACPGEIKIKRNLWSCLPRKLKLISASKKCKSLFKEVRK